MATVAELLRRGDDLPSDSARRDAEILLGYTLSQSRSWLYTWPEREVPAPQAQQYLQLMTERRQGQPIAYLLGQREFWSLPLQVNRHTLIPRPETETLVSWALEVSLPPAAQVLDLGTGCGAIALALARERPRWNVCGLDASAEALVVARDNAARLDLARVQLLHSHWYAAVAGKQFDLLVSNPPYIDAIDVHLASGDVRFEPRSALVAAEGGLADIIHLIRGARAQLHTGGWLLLEHGFSQGPEVRALLQDNGFSAIETRGDFAGHERITGGRSDAR